MRTGKSATVKGEPRESLSELLRRQGSRVNQLRNNHLLQVSSPINSHKWFGRPDRAEKARLGRGKGDETKSMWIVGMSVILY